MAAAEKLMGLRPYQEVAIAPLLAIAEVQPPILYYHFKDKEGLFVEWAAQAFSGIGEKFRLRAGTSLTEGLTAFSTIFLLEVPFDIDQVLRDIPGLVRPESQEAVYNAYFQALYEPLCAILIEAMERNELPPEPIGPVADVFLAGLHQLRKKGAPGYEVTTAKWYAQRFVNGFGAA